MHTTLLAFMDDLYEDLELWYPKLRLEEAGYSTTVAALEIGNFNGKHGYPAKADALINEIDVSDFSGLLSETSPERSSV
jgi:protease I